MRRAHRRRQNPVVRSLSFAPRLLDVRDEKEADRFKKPLRRLSAHGGQVWVDVKELSDLKRSLEVQPTTVEVEDTPVEGTIDAVNSEPTDGTTR